MTDFTTRFAPSPTGYLHLGHAFAALTAYDAARRAKGRFLLRLEDIDLPRCKPEFDAAIFEDLDWLGLTWEQPVRRQSEHFNAYEQALAQLQDKGVVYRCFKTRKEIAGDIARAPHLTTKGPEGPPYFGTPLAPEDERAQMERGAPFAWRLSMEAAHRSLGQTFEALSVEEEIAPGKIISAPATPAIFGDAIIARKDLGTSYHLACVHDDALQGVTHVIRGEDLYHAAHLHRLLQALLELPAPIYRHHRLITDGKGARLTKRDKAATLRAMREGGATPDDIRSALDLNA